MDTEASPSSSPLWWENWNLVYLSSAFGPIYGGGSVQEAFYNTLQLWFPTYVAEMNRQLGAEILEVPQEWRFRPDFRTLPRTAKAAILVSVPHTVGTPENFQDGIRAQWRVDVMIYVFGTQNWDETQALTYAYAACLRSRIMQNRDLGGFAQTTMWEGEQYLEGEHSSTRTTGIAHVQFIVTLGNVTQPFAGLGSPAFAANFPVKVMSVSDINIMVSGPQTLLGSTLLSFSTTSIVASQVTNSNTVNLTAANTAIAIGQSVSGQGVVGSPTVTGVSGTSITLSTVQTIAANVVLIFSTTAVTAFTSTDQELIVLQSANPSIVPGLIVNGTGINGAVTNPTINPVPMQPEVSTVDITISTPIGINS